MKKEVRVILYLLSMTAVVVLFMLLFRGKPTETVNSVEKIPEPTENFTTETETEMENHVPAGTEADDAIIPETESGQADTTLLFAGDVLIKESVESLYQKSGAAGLVSQELLTEMQNADIMMVNHEFQFSSRGEPMADKQYTFRTDPKNVQILLDLGVDIVSLANNHSLDYGQEALQDTFATLDEAGILYAGAGESRERAEALQIIEANGKKFGFLAATRVIPAADWNIENRQPGLFAAYDDTRLTERIKESKEACDFLTVYVHWGIEREEYPEEYQKVIARHCAEAGADLIIGAHPHVLQGIEFMEGKPVFYSLGNYIFNQNISKTMLVKVTVKADGTVAYSLIPAFAADGRTQIFKGEEAENLCTYLNELSVKNYVDKEGNILNKTE